MKQIKVMLVILLSVIALLCGCGNETITQGIIVENLSDEISAELEQAVAQAIIDDNRDCYLEGECPAEGHIIYGKNEDGNKLNVYTYMSYAWYGFIDGNFVDVSGGGLPAVMVFDKNTLELIEIKYPEDGENYIKSISQMFPKEYIKRALNQTEKECKELKEQLEAYASAYLKEIGREAKIGDYSDFEHTLLTDVGVSVEVSNSLSEIEKTISYYPYWIGNQEIIEDGTRFVYQMDYDKDNNQVIYTKYIYDKPAEVVEKIIVDSLTGKVIE